ncbi:MAG: bifunctional acetate--CoA ligase family protein/GNAT family N-acetyltransferase [Acidobacteriota bacterium]|nr:bifunctional acetate--CoA ligase family protein/GNAT family N-acetyltransferase [Acidobacteriota bacterium]
MSPIGKIPPSSVSPSHDVLRADSHPLDWIFKPKSVALIGASERAGSVGRTVLWNLISSPFGGTIYPVNPKRPNILGIRSYPSVRELPEVPDLVVVCTPAEGVPALLTDCVSMGVPGGIVISAGFKETGEAGQRLETQIMEAIQGRMRIIGPNCLGVMNPITGLNATFANAMARPGNVAFISQSGALCTAVLDWSLRENVGFSGFVSIGSMLDVNWGDLIDYYGSDPRTQSIVIYMETIGDAASFLSAAREVSLTKPIIVIKAGRTAAAAKAAASHTGSLTGSDDVLEAAFRRVGVLRVNSIAEIFYMTEALSKQPRPRGNRLGIVTNAGGPGVLATDALIQGGGELADITPESMKAYNEILPAAWSHNNPIDILGDAEPERYAKSLQIAAKDPNIDGMLVIMTPQGMTNPTKIAEQLKPYAHGLGKPLLASWMGGESVSKGLDILNSAGIPTFLYPDTAVHAFNYMWRYTYNLRGLYETPSPNSAGYQPDRQRAREILSTVRGSGRTILTEYESKKLLESYGIPSVPTEIATSEDEAVRAAEIIGYPVVLKLHSYTITHKTDVGGVVLNLPNAERVRQAYTQIRESVAAKAGEGHFQGVTVQPFARQEGYELILGSSLDSQFGPVLLFGTGGQLVEVFKDRSLALPPLNTTLARRMMEQTSIYKALHGVRGRKSVDMAALEELMVRFSDLVIENPAIKEIDINPLLASPERLLALDARVVVHDVAVPDDQLPRSAIRPYPVQYVSRWTAKNGGQVLIRPIRPEDEPLMIEFHKRLSERSVYLRYFQPLKLTQRTAHDRLTRICFIDYDREMALVVERTTAEGAPEIVAVGRLSKIHGRSEAELAALVQDDVQGQGIGVELYRRLIDIARQQKLAKVHSNMLGENKEMQHLCQHLGFKLSAPDLEDNLILAELTL